MSARDQVRICRIIIAFLRSDLEIHLKTTASLPWSQERGLVLAADNFPALIIAQITCLYDMDIVFQPSGNFDEVYLYEELMEADLHAIVSLHHLPASHQP